MRPIIIIPARMASTRLPGKPLAMIGQRPMIVHVADRAQEAGIGPVLIATDSEEVLAVAQKYGHDAVMTAENHPSGSDRIVEALDLWLAKTSGTVDCIINLQGDLPLINPRLIHQVHQALAVTKCDIATLCAEITDADEHENPNVVKAITSFSEGQNIAKAYYFTRATAPWGEGPRYHHIGIYAYRLAALRQFIAYAPSTLEQRERLEQLRALENGMTIGIAKVDDVPVGVDTPADLEKARAMIAAQTS